MSKYFCLIFILCVTTISNSHAESYIRDYTYNASDADSKISSRAIALDQLKTLLLQEIGTHIRHKLNVSKDSLGNSYANEEIEAISAGLTKIEILKETWDGKTYFVSAKIDADTDSVLNALNEFKKSNELQLQMINDSYKLHNQVKKDIALLNNQLKNNENSKEITEQYIKNTQKLSTNLIFDNAWKLDNQKQYKSSAVLYEKAANQGHIVAQTRLGFMYMIGKGVKQSDTQAKKWLQKASNNGYPQAIKYWGDLYAQGIGVPYNQTTAVYWYKEAAKKGNIEAMHELSFYYSTGEGSQDARNPELAKYWYDKASDARKVTH